MSEGRAPGTAPRGYPAPAELACARTSQPVMPMAWNPAAAAARW